MPRLLFHSLAFWIGCELCRYAGPFIAALISVCADKYQHLACRCFDRKLTNSLVMWFVYKNYYFGKKVKGPSSWKVSLKILERESCKFHPLAKLGNNRRMLRNNLCTSRKQSPNIISLLLLKT